MKKVNFADMPFSMAKKLGYCRGVVVSIDYLETFSLLYGTSFGFRLPNSANNRP
jgi:hypothetical protein